MAIANCWKLFCYGIKRDHYEKFIGIWEFSVKIAVDYFNNTFTTDTGTPAKNTHFLNDIDSEGTVYSFWKLIYSIYPTRNSEISTISDITITTAMTTAIDHTDSKELQLEGGR